jgi:hypothetical protein
MILEYLRLGQGANTSPEGVVRESEGDLLNNDEALRKKDRARRYCCIVTRLAKTSAFI